MNRDSVNPAVCVAAGVHAELKRDPIKWAAGTFPAAGGDRQYTAPGEYVEVACCAACTSLVAREAQS